jgi:c-di-GMP-binding flagellar brake protein YcgR
MTKPEQDISDPSKSNPSVEPDAVLLENFRVTSNFEIRAILKQICDAGVILTITSENGANYVTRMWAFDTQRDVVSFAADDHDSRLASLTESEDLTVVGYLDSIKIQFELSGLLLVHNGKQSALHSSFPRELYRFQRRSGFRVRPLLNSTPTAHFVHPDVPDLELDLRVLDVSVGGCAVFLSDGIPDLRPGANIPNARIQLDADTRVLVNLRLQYVSVLNPDSHGIRLGFEMVNLPADAERALVRFVDQTQRRRRFLARE